MSNVYAFEAGSLTDQRVPLSQYKGKILLIANTASKCRFTPQYAGLEAVYERLRGKGLGALGFPCNQSGKQGSGGADEIDAFCERNYGMSFPMFGKIDVNGFNAHPLCKWLASEKPGVLGIGAIKWNFTKFLLHRGDATYRHYAPLTKPEGIADNTERLLAEPGLA